jgi:hypothetical protein
MTRCIFTKKEDVLHKAVFYPSQAALPVVFGYDEPTKVRTEVAVFIIDQIDAGTNLKMAHIFVYEKGYGATGHYQYPFIDYLEGTSPR